MADFRPFKLRDKDTGEIFEVYATDQDQATRIGQMTPDNIAAHNKMAQAGYADPGRLGASTTGIGEMMPFSDELNSAGAAVGAEIGQALGLPGSTDKTFSERYNENQEYAQHGRDLAEELHPTSKFVGNIAGGAGALASRGYQAAAPLMEIGKSALIGGAYDSTLGLSEGDSASDRLWNSLYGGAGGAAFGAVGQGLAEGVAKLSRDVIRPVWRGIRHPEAQAETIRREALADDRTYGASARVEETGLDDDTYEWARRNNYPVRQLDRGGSATDEIVNQSFNSDARQARNIYSQAKDDMEGQYSRANAVVDRMLPNTTGDRARRDAIIRRGREAVAPLYREAFSHPRAQQVWDNDLENLMQNEDFRKEMVEAFKVGRTREILGDASAPVVGNERMIRRQRMNDGTTRWFWGDENVTPNLAYWDHVKKGLDGRISDLEDTFSPKNATKLRLLRDMRGFLVNKLDNLGTGYDRARSGAGRYLGAEDASQMGRDLFRGHARFDSQDVARRVASLTPEEREQAAYSFLEAYKKDLSLKARGDFKGQADLSLKGLRTKSQEEIAEIILGPERFNALKGHDMVERVIAMRRKGIDDNSKTARRELGADLMMGAAGAGAGNYMTGDPTSVLSYAPGVALAGLTRSGRRLANRRISPHVARSMMSPTSDPDAYADIIQEWSRKQRGGELSHFLSLVGRQTIPNFLRDGDGEDENE